MICVARLADADRRLDRLGLRVIDVRPESPWRHAEPAARARRVSKNLAAFELGQLIGGEENDGEWFILAEARVDIEARLGVGSDLLNHGEFRAAGGTGIVGFGAFSAGTSRGHRGCGRKSRPSVLQRRPLNRFHRVDATHHYCPQNGNSNLHPFHRQSCLPLWACRFGNPLHAAPLFSHSLRVCPALTLSIEL